MCRLRCGSSRRGGGEGDLGLLRIQRRTRADDAITFFFFYFFLLSFFLFLFLCVLRSPS